jgi:hypothetical protein
MLYIYIRQCLLPLVTYMQKLCINATYIYKSIGYTTSKNHKRFKNHANIGSDKQTTSTRKGR